MKARIEVIHLHVMQNDHSLKSNNHVVVFGLFVAFCFDVFVFFCFVSLFGNAIRGICSPKTFQEDFEKLGLEVTIVPW